MLHWISQVSSRKAIIVMAIAHVVIFGSILISLEQLREVSGGAGILDLKWGYSVEFVRTTLDSYGAEGMRIYHRIQLLDLLNPAIYGLLLGALLYNMWRGSVWQRVALWPIVCAVLDYVENSMLYIIVDRYPDLPTTIIEFSSAISLAKHITLLASTMALLVGLVARIRAKRRGL